ncbi:MAG: acyl carrier protein [Bacteroidota bacterium]
MKDINAILSSILELSENNLKDELKMEDIALWDSLRHMELIANIESSLGFELSFEEISEMTSIGKIREIVSNKNK